MFIQGNAARYGNQGSGSWSHIGDVWGRVGCIRQVPRPRPWGLLASVEIQISRALQLRLAEGHGSIRLSRVQKQEGLANSASSGNFPDCLMEAEPLHKIQTSRKDSGGHS